MQLARAYTLLNDAKISELSFATRLTCTIDAVYQCIASELKQETQQEDTCMGDEKDIQCALKSLNLNNDDLILAKSLFSWHRNRWHFPRPPCSINEAIEWAARIVRTREQRQP